MILKYHNNWKVVIDSLCPRQNHEEKGLHPVAWDDDQSSNSRDVVNCGKHHLDFS